MDSTYLEKNLKILRKYHDYTQEDMSIILNVSRSCYSMYEIGMRKPDLEMLILLSEKFRIPIQAFFSDSSSFRSILFSLKSPSSF